MNETEIGKEYRLLPEARFHTDMRHGGFKSAAVHHRVTRVRARSGPNEHGDYTVTGLDGSFPNSGGYLVHPKYLAPLDEPADEPKPTPPDTRTPAEIIAKALDRAFVEEPAVWLHASVDIDPDGTWGVVVTLDPDVGYDTEYRLTLKEV